MIDSFTNIILNEELSKESIELKLITQEELNEALEEVKQNQYNPIGIKNLRKCMFSKNNLTIQSTKWKEENKETPSMTLEETVYNSLLNIQYDDLDTTEECFYNYIEIGEQEPICPNGTNYKGKGSNSAICSDPNMICPCENCSFGEGKKIILYGSDNEKEICVDCSHDNECKEGFHCFNRKCINNNVLIENNKTTQCNQYKCDNCKREHEFQYGGSLNRPEEMNNKCIECSNSIHCNEGYKCEAYQCIPE